MIRFPQKLLIPTAARATIGRPEQQSQLGHLIGTHQATILVAPAGWGKTTMLVQWAQAAALPIAWYSLDVADRDPYQLADYLLAAVAPFVAEAADLARRLPHIRPSELPLFLRECAAALANARQPFALILDDAHLLTDTDSEHVPDPFASVMDFLATLIDYTRSCHLVLLSRTLPKGIPGLIRQVAQQRVAVLDYLALQWGASEVMRLGASYAIQLPEPLAAELARRYNGWVVGIVLALDSVARQAQPGMPVQLSDDIGQVYAFFAEQIIRPLPADLQRFLEETSVLEDLSPQRCNALCQRTNAAVLLDDLLGRGLFLSQRGGWLSYHSLFRDFLRARLARDADRERTMLARAGDIYAGEDALERAVDCYCQAHARERAIDLVRSTVPRYRQRAQQTTLIRCMDVLQEDADSARQPYRLPADLLLARAQLYGDLALWERAYLDLNFVELLGDQALVWEAQILRVDLLALQGALDEARFRLRDIPPADQMPLHLRYRVRYTAGRLALLDAEVHQGMTLLRAAIEDSTASGARPESLAAIYDLLGYGYAVSGELSEARRALQRADACWQISGDSGRRAMTLNNIAVLAIDECRLADARSALNNALALAQETSRLREEAIIRLSLADLALAEGVLDEADAQFATTYMIAQRAQIVAEQVSAAAGAAFSAALAHDPNAAEQWLGRLPDSASLTPDLQGRVALARALVSPDSVRSHALREAEGIRASLRPVETAIFDLLAADTQLSADRNSFIDWPALGRVAEILPEPLLPRLLIFLSALSVAAPATSALSRRIRLSPETRSPARWAVHALGNFGCVSDGHTVDLSPLHRTLLIRLLDVGPGGMSTDQLWEDVWGDTHLSMGALHKALSRLREQTGMPIAARGGHCTIGVEWTQLAFDVQDFERALAEPALPAPLQRAIDCYAGEFLPSAAPTALAWVDVRRTYLRQRYLGALDQLASLLEADEPARALMLYQRAFQIDRSREQTATRLMALASRQGNHRLVSETFAQLSEALTSLGLTPLSSTSSLYTHLR
ncbi:MAG: transcriptional regulator [Oscillochloris sp.]|nr:transcriptional regulator [Oscillochloris sp.]